MAMRSEPHNPQAFEIILKAEYYLLRLMKGEWKLTSEEWGAFKSSLRHIVDLGKPVQQ